MNEILQTALRHAGMRRPVFPADPATKRPMTAHGFKDATLDTDTIAGWFDCSRPPMIGLPTGSVTRLVVLDWDGEEGAESLRRLEREHGALPRTASAVTPRGGAHLYFSHPGGEIPNSAGKLGPAIDVRGDGGYVIVPPSLAASGRRYEVDEEAPPAQVPPWLLAAIRGNPSRVGKTTPASEWTALVRDGLAEGKRNQGLASLVGHLLARDVDARLVAELAHLANGRFRPPLDGAEVDQVVASIAGREIRRRTGARP